MNVEIGAEAAQFPEKEYINGIARCSVYSEQKVFRLSLSLAVCEKGKNIKVRGHRILFYFFLFRV